MRKLVAFAVCSSFLLVAACSGDGKGTEPPVKVNCSLSVPVTSFVKGGPQVVTFSSDCDHVTVSSTSGVFTTPQTMGSYGTIDLSSIAAGSTVTLVGSLDGRPASAPVSITVIPAVPVALDLTCDSPSTVTTATKVKCHIPRSGAVRTEITLGNMPTLPDSAASVPRYFVNPADSNEVTLDVGTIVTKDGFPRTLTVSAIGNDGSLVTKVASFNVISVALTAVDSMTTWIPVTGGEVHFYSKCGFASQDGKFDDPNRTVGTRTGFDSGAAADAVYHNCSSISTFISVIGTPREQTIQMWLFRPGRDAVFVGTVHMGGTQPSNTIGTPSALWTPNDGPQTVKLIMSARKP